MIKEDFTVTMISELDESVTRLLNVISVDDSAKTFTVQFPGAGSGFYFFKIIGNGGSIESDKSTIRIQTIL